MDRNAVGGTPPRRSLDSSPLLGNGSSNGVGGEAARNGGGTSVRRSRLSVAARLLRQASSRRMMREPSVRVREAAAEQLEERQSDWAYSRPVVVLDLVWNLVFVVVGIAVLILSIQERPTTPLRVWIVGYALQCFVHMMCVCFEYRRRHHHRIAGSSGAGISPADSSSSDEELDEEETQNSTGRISLAKRLESANTLFSFFWWIVGFYWITTGGHALVQDSPRLYWLCVVFLAFDVFFVVFCVALACVIGIAVCCCLPCIIGILYAVADQEGAPEEDIQSLPKYKFWNVNKTTGDKSRSSGGVMRFVGSSEAPVERFLSAEDAECCICISTYDDSAELRELPCSHHFHCSCIDKWLRINATCPLCKYNITKSSNNGREEA